ncbi:hypothetical protein V1477_019286 [Vespula maculifrons]|uniref:Uncharacterized protein n=3 Tax=Vespula TaxID=7451 RepID=A0A834J443_VESGE|nr:hypothetical protein HZH68_016017 [Vespula germanica]KAF7392320.1 hypothetical protein H0235_017319 [Vespula pensylvanica]
MVLSSGFSNIHKALLPSSLETSLIVLPNETRICCRGNSRDETSELEDGRREAGVCGNVVSGEPLSYRILPSLSSSKKITLTFKA